MATASELAFRALVDARYNLVDRHPQLGDVATRLRILSPADNAEHAAKHNIALISASRSEIFYNPQAVVALTSEELVYSIAHVALSLDFVADYEECSDRDRRAASIAINWMVNARLKEMRLGVQPRHCINNPSITSNHTFSQSMAIARAWIEQVMANESYVFG